MSRTHQGDILKNQMSQEKKELEQLKSQYDLLANQIEQTMNSTTTGASGMISGLHGKNKLARKNIQLGSGKLGYVTNTGVFKPYISTAEFDLIKGRNGCPPDVVQIKSGTTESTNVGSVLSTDPPLIVGQPMRVGQYCGEFGRNIRVGRDSNPDIEYKGVVPYYPGMEHQADIKESGASLYDSCRVRAIDQGSQAFGLMKNEEGIKCYTGELPPTPAYNQGSIRVGFNKAFSAPMTEIGLRPNAISLSAYNGNTGFWTTARRSECYSNSAGSLINGIQATYGGNCSNV